MNNNGIEYKGIFYNETKEKRYYEGGAHFKYKQLFSVLSQLAKAQSEKSPSAQQKQLTTSQSMPSIHNHVPSSQKKIIMIKLRKDAQNLNASLPIADDSNNKKVLLPPASKLIRSRNNMTIGHNNHQGSIINQPYSFSLKFHSSVPKNRNNSFIRLSSNRKQSKHLNNMSSNANNVNYSSVLVPMINQQHDQQNVSSRNRKIPVTSLYSNLTNIKLEQHKNVNDSVNVAHKKMRLTLRKDKKSPGSASGVNDSSHSVVCHNNHSRNGSNVIIGRQSAMNLKKTLINRKNDANCHFGINHILGANKKVEATAHNKFHKNALVFPLK